MQGSNSLLMGTTEKHMKILDMLSSIFIKKNYFYGREQIALAINKNKLIDIDSLSKTNFASVKAHINRFKVVYPDFMIFEKNSYIINEKRTRVVGIPNLIIEVWSDSNSDEEKEEKRKLYKTGRSEFWEIRQDSIWIDCHSADGKLYKQSIEHMLLTPWKDRIDLKDI